MIAVSLGPDARPITAQESLLHRSPPLLLRRLRGMSAALPLWGTVTVVGAPEGGDPNRRMATRGATFV